jgi:phosphopantothenoylcysteine decarboxylase / phosphopantothenate---cysteine ligase
MAHINLSRDADAILVAPASADFMAKLLHGRADDLLSLMCLARPLAQVPLDFGTCHEPRNVGAPCHPAQYGAAAPRWRPCAGRGPRRPSLRRGGRRPHAWKPMNCWTSWNRLVSAQSAGRPACAGQRRPNFEAIDPVRGITNLSSGKMAFALARAAWRSGSPEVQLGGRSCQLDHPLRRGSVRERSAQPTDARSCDDRRRASADVFIAAAAVADWRPAQVAGEKIKKGQDGLPSPLTWVENTDILARCGRSNRAQAGALYCVGFAAESHVFASPGAGQAASQRRAALMVGNHGPCHVWPR